MMEKLLNILLIENDQVDCMAVKRFIVKHSLPYRLDVAETLSQGAEMLGKSAYDVVLVDYLLADGTGFEILSAAGKTPVIIITGNGNEEIAIEAMRRGAYDYLIKDHDRNYLVLLSTAIDSVLERKQAEIAMEESEERYRTIVETVSDIIFQLDPDQKITFINSAIRELGYDPATIIGQSVEEFLYPEDKGKVNLIATRRVGVRATRNLEVRFRFKSAAHEWYEMKKIAVLLDSYGMWSVPEAIVQTEGSEKTFVGTLCIARNITKRKQAEDALRESEMRIRAILDNVADAIVTLNDQGIVESFNLAGERIFGYPGAEITGKSFRELVADSSHCLYEKKVSGFFVPDTVRPADIKKCELEGRRKDGSTFSMDLSVTKMELAANCLFIGIIRDITERKEAEEKLQQFAEELKRSNRELQAFATVVSHDLQEPLRKITTFGDRLLGEDSGLSGKGRDYMERMQKSARRMQIFIDGLLAYSKITTKPKKFEPTDLNLIVGEILADLEVRIAQTKGTVNVGSLPVLEADPLQMRQLFQNLIANGLKFHREGSPPVINLSGCKDDGGNWEIRVEDNGIGFDEKYADRVFQPFERLHVDQGYEGTGIGLAICQKIVALHGGGISVRSVPQRGTVFFIRLPERQAARNDGCFQPQ